MLRIILYKHLDKNNTYNKHNLKQYIHNKNMEYCQKMVLLYKIKNSHYNIDNITFIINNQCIL